MAGTNKLAGALSLLVLGSLVILSVSCGGAVRSGNPDREARQGNTVTIDPQRPGVQDLTVYLKQLSGVQVQGDGPGAQILVRGINSLTLSSAPLFVLNGIPIGNEFSEVYYAVDVQLLRKVRVLKSAVETSAYGMRGSNGVIEMVTD